MQPDLFAGAAQRDDSYRILARLAHGGSLPAPARTWHFERALRARLAVAGGLLLVGVVAWVWLKGVHTPVAPTPVADRLAGASPTPRQPVEAPEPQAATIVNPEVIPDAARGGAGGAIGPVRSAASAAAPANGVSAGARRAAPNAPLKLARRPPQQPTGAPATEGDEDVTLLAAMLKHAKPHKPATTPPPKD